MLTCLSPNCKEDKDEKEFTLFKRNPALKSRKGRIIFCKECTNKFVTERGNTKQSLRELCQIIDIPFIDNLADSALKQYNKKKKLKEKGTITHDQTNIFNCYAKYIGVMNPNYINYSFSDDVRDNNIEGKIQKLEQLKDDLMPVDIKKEKELSGSRRHIINYFGEDCFSDLEKLSKAIQIKFAEFDLDGSNNARQKKYQLKMHIKKLIDNELVNKEYFGFLYREEIEEDRESEKIYSKEWKGYYTKEDLDDLNQYYNDLNTDFKITTRNHKDYARKIAKASLAMDKAFEDFQNGVIGADKRYKDFKDTFDSLSKSAQFAENTRSQNDVALGCFGKVFEVVENHHWIPEWDSYEKDQIDVILDQFSNIDKSL
jgi:hypothetical protein